jgi:hypothetical protein
VEQWQARAAGTAPQAAHPPARAALRQAQLLLVQGKPAATAATIAKVPAPTLANTFNADGRLLVTRDGEALLELPADEEREPFGAMPRALRRKDATRLVACLQAVAGAPDAEVLARVAQAGVPSEVMAFLFGESGLRADRLLALPADQAASL